MNEFIRLIKWQIEALETALKMLIYRMFIKRGCAHDIRNFHAVLYDSGLVLLRASNAPLKGERHPCAQITIMLFLVSFCESLLAFCDPETFVRYGVCNRSL